VLFVFAYRRQDDQVIAKRKQKIKKNQKRKVREKDMPLPKKLRRG